MYDYSVNVYSPDGRVYQVEYATKSSENSPTCLGIRFPGGIVLATENPIQSKLLKRGNCNRRILNVDEHAGMVCAGQAANDSALLRSLLLHYVEKFRLNWSCRTPAATIRELLCGQMHLGTLHGNLRPFGITAIIGVVDDNGPTLLMAEPNASTFEYNACAAGKGAKNAKNELEKLSIASLSPEQAVMEAARIIVDANNATQARDFELEISWICEQSGWKHVHIPEPLHSQAVAFAKARLEEKMQE